MSTYYVIKEANNTYTLRQTRFAVQYRLGNEHPHDSCAQGFTKEGMKKLVQEYSFDIDDASKSVLGE